MDFVPTKRITSPMQSNIAININDVSVDDDDVYDDDEATAKLYRKKKEPSSRLKNGLKVFLKAQSKLINRATIVSLP